MDVRAWASRAWPGRRWERASVTHGAFHKVVALDDVVARVATGDAARGRTEREVATLRAVAPLGLPLDVPRAVGAPVHLDGASGALCTFVPGHARPDARWEEMRDGLARVLDALRAVRPDDHPHVTLPPVRAWCGGPAWAAVVHDDLAPRLPWQVAAIAVEVVARIQAEAGAAATLVHGDLNLHNILWSDGRPSGLIDLDHAAWTDPAVDVAPLVGAFGADRVSEIVGHKLLERAMHHRASLPLQVAAGAHVIGNDALRDHALGNFVSRATSGTLHSPDGRSPIG